MVVEHQPALLFRVAAASVADPTYPLLIFLCCTSGIPLLQLRCPTGATFALEESESALSREKIKTVDFEKAHNKVLITLYPFHDLDFRAAK